MEAVKPALIEWGVASLALVHQSASGDEYAAQAFPKGFLIAAIDGLGHGEEAAQAARIAAQILRSHAGEAVVPLLNRCHHALRATRGVVLSMASFNATEGTMTWLGIGNVEGTLHRADPAATPRCESLVLRRGVVGGPSERPCAWITPVAPGDTVILATDGIRSGLSAVPVSSSSPRQLADRIFSLYRKQTDDALVLVARYNGAQQIASAGYAH